MTAHTIKDIPPGSLFSTPVYLDDGFVLAPAELPLDAALLRALGEWSFPEVFCEGETREGPAGEADAGAPETADPAGEWYRDLHGYVERLFMRAALGMGLEKTGIAEKVKTIHAALRGDRGLLRGSLRGEGDEEGNSFLAAHAVRSTILSLFIGEYLKLNDERLLELGTAALVHEIGMVKVPQRIYTARGVLSPEERVSILGHPAAGAAILKANGFPSAVSLAALQHHEREDGSGYPQMLSGDRISLYAKIIAAACSYEAVAAGRPYNEAKDGHSELLGLLKNEGKRYDDRIIRALVYSLRESAPGGGGGD